MQQVCLILGWFLAQLEDPENRYRLLQWAFAPTPGRTEDVHLPRTPNRFRWLAPKPHIGTKDLPVPITQNRFAETP